MYFHSASERSVGYLFLMRATATIRTIDLGKVNGRSWDDESLLRRPATEGSRGGRATRHVQVRGSPPFRHQPLLGQALHQTRFSRRAPYPKKGRRKTPQSGRAHKEAPRG